MTHPSSMLMFKLRGILSLAVFLTALATGAISRAQANSNAELDVLVLNNGDTVHGKFVSEIDGKVTFHTDAFGDVTLGWDKIKELHTSRKFAVLNKQEQPPSRKAARRLPTGTLTVVDNAVTVTPDNGPAEPPIPLEHAQYMMDAATLDKQVNREPGVLSAWAGAATAGATLVAATQKQYTVSAGVALVRTVPTAAWLRTRNRSSIDFTGSLGKITQPSYTILGPPPTLVPAVSTKSTIYHAGAERDQYFSAHLFALAQTAFDHNYSQDLDLQEVFGGGIGWTAIKNPRQQLDLKATLQYEKQEFISSPLTNQNLLGSTFSAAYILHMNRVTYAQTLSFIPAYNNARAYSATETNTFAFPAYKNLSFSVGTLDSYLNDPPAAVPPTKRNSFQFTMGFTYAIKSKY